MNVKPLQVSFVLTRDELNRLLQTGSCYCSLLIHLLVFCAYIII